MASISISDLYRGEGPGEKYGGILNAVFHEIFTKGIPGGLQRTNVDRAADGEAHLSRGGTNENRRRRCFEIVRSGVAFLRQREGNSTV